MCRTQIYLTQRQRHELKVRIGGQSTAALVCGAVEVYRHGGDQGVQSLRVWDDWR